MVVLPKGFRVLLAAETIYRLVRLTTSCEAKDTCSFMHVIIFMYNAAPKAPQSDTHTSTVHRGHALRTCPSKARTWRCNRSCTKPGCAGRVTSGERASCTECRHGGVSSHRYGRLSSEWGLFYPNRWMSPMLDSPVILYLLRSNYPKTHLAEIYN